MTKTELTEDRKAYFVDANVLLATGQPERGEMCAASQAFLVAAREHHHRLTVGPLIEVEVDVQLTEFPHKYRQPHKVMRWLLRCETLEISQQVVRIEALSIAYAGNGWAGEHGDANDRIHAATASVHGIPMLVTWEARFLQQEEWITSVNRGRGLQPLRLLTPTQALALYRDSLYDARSEP